MLNSLTLPDLAIHVRPRVSARVVHLPAPKASTPFESFAREHEAVLLSVAVRLCGNATDARDLVQDTFERGLKSFDRFVPGTNGRGWLLTILHNLFVDRCRQLRRERRADVEPEALELPGAEEEPAPAWGAITPEQVELALQKLSPEFREVYRLHALEGRSYTEIAERLRIPKATVGTRLIRARRRLKALLAPAQDVAP